MTVVLEHVNGATVTDLNNGTAYSVVGTFVPSYTPNEDGTITDTWRLAVVGASASALQTNIDALYALERTVERWMKFKDSVNRIYIHYQPEGRSTQRQTQLTALRFVDVTWQADKPQANVRFFEMHATHLPFAEGVSLVDVPLTNGNATDNVDGTINTFNCNDNTGSAPNKRNMWVQVNDEDVLGDLPAGCRLQIGTHDSNARFIYGCGAIYDVADNICQEVEGVSGTTTTADANCSAGNYATVPANTQIALTINSAEMRGGMYLPVMRAQYAATGAGVTVQSGLWGQAVTIYPSYATGNFGFIPLVPMKLPEMWYSNDANLPTMFFTSTLEVKVDFVVWIPMDCGWRIADAVSLTPAPNYIVDDTTLDYVYFSYTTPQETTYVGPGIYLEPGKDQRLWIIGQYNTPGTAAGAAVDAYHPVLLKYRPRYRSL